MDKLCFYPFSILYKVLYAFYIYFPTMFFFRFTFIDIGEGSRIDYPIGTELFANPFYIPPVRNIQMRVLKIFTVDKGFIVDVHSEYKIGFADTLDYSLSQKTVTPCKKYSRFWHALNNVLRDFLQRPGEQSPGLGSSMRLQYFQFLQFRVQIVQFCA